jgi:cytochrome c oxidase cbb3-type subunit 3
MADQDQDRLLDHNYDGIQEYDNPMPRWWVTIFWATIVFAVLYWFNVPGIGPGDGRVAAYEADMTRARAAQAALQLSGGPTAEQLAALQSDQAAMTSGKQVFTQNCAACHRADGGGLIGPNLTDDAWIHGSSLLDMHKTISEGVLAKGMPAWGKVLKPDQVSAVTVYVASLRGSNPANPKPPEGTPGTP